MSSPEVAGLLRVRSQYADVLSVYLNLSADPVDTLRGLPGRLGALLGEVETQVAQESNRRRRLRLAADLDAVRRTVIAHAREWLGHSVAVFAAADLQLFETKHLPCAMPDRGILGTRPYVRPLLAATRRCAPYCAAVVDSRHAWLFRIDAGGIEVIGRLDDEGLPSSSFAGWYGLEEYKTRNRATELARHHYRATVAALAKVFGIAGYDRLVVGGHAEGIPLFLSMLTGDLRDRLAGTFVIDPHTITAAHVREHAGGVLANWVDAREHRLVTEMLSGPANGRLANGLQPCLDAASQHAVQLLAIADDVVAPGSSCGGCGALGVDDGPCPVCGTPTRPVPDVIEELAVQVLDDGGTVEPVRITGTVLARLRHPIVAARH